MGFLINKADLKLANTINTGCSTLNFPFWPFSKNEIIHFYEFVYRGGSLLFLCLENDVALNLDLAIGESSSL